jgi:hypothetical protein
VSKDHKENRGLLALLGVTELMAGMVLLAWAGMLVLLALLVSAVQLAHRGLPDPKAPLVRRVPAGHRVRRGSRAHRVPSVPWVRPDRLAPRARKDPPDQLGWMEFPEWKDYQARRAGQGSTSPWSRSTNGNRSTRI